MCILGLCNLKVDGIRDNIGFTAQVQNTDDNFCTIVCCMRGASKTDTTLLCVWS